MTNKNYTDITIILDRSGSMSTIKNDMEGGFKTFLAEQKKLPGLVKLSLVQFDDVYTPVYTAVNINEAPDLVLEPRGMTALYDAVGKTVASLGQRLSAMPEHERPGNVIVLIVTDGGENSSREYTGDKVKEMIQEQTNKYNWVFSYLGANQDAMFVGQSIGISLGNIANYSNANATHVWTASSAGILRSVNGGNFAYSSQEKDKLLQRGNS